MKRFSVLAVLFGILVLLDSFGRKHKSKQEYIINTIKNYHTNGQIGISAMVAAFKGPGALVVDKKGNLYVLFRFLYINKIDTHGIVTTIAGDSSTQYKGDGLPATATGFSATDMAIDNAGNIYLPLSQARICRIDTNGIITTIAGTGKYDDNVCKDGELATKAEINPPVVKVDSKGNIYTTDVSGIRKINRKGIISTFLKWPIGPYFYRLIGIDHSNNLYVVVTTYFADHLKEPTRIVKIDTNGTITNFAGNGKKGYKGDGGLATAARLEWASAITFDNRGNAYIIDDERVRAVTSQGIIYTIAGNKKAGFKGDGGPATACMLNAPGGIAVDSLGNIYIADSGNGRIRELTPVKGRY